MKKVPVEYHAWGDKWNEEHHTWERFEETGITYEYIPTTRKEKIKKKLNDIGSEIFYILFMIFFVPIGFLYFIIKDLILKEDNTKQKKVDIKQKKVDIKQKKVDLNLSRQDENDYWETW